MRALLFGARGQLGSDLRAACPPGVELTAPGREALDITDPGAVYDAIAAARPDVVINTAAYVNVDGAEDHGAEAFRVNALAVRDMARACAGAGASLVSISTDYVFDGAKVPEPYCEDDTPGPLNTYGMTKYAGELYIRAELERFHIVRLSSLYGVIGARGKAGDGGGNFVYNILDKARRGETLRVVDDIVMSPTFSVDAARGIWDMLLSGMPFGIRHMSNEGHCSWHGFARKILELAGVDAEVLPVSRSEYPARARRPLWSAMTSARGPGMRPWQEGLEDFLGLIGQGRRARTNMKARG